MALWTNVKGMWDPQARAQSVVETQITTFNAFASRYPERDVNAWLASTLMARPGFRGGPELIYYTETAIFSLAPLSEAPVALALYIIHKEEPALALAYADAFEAIMMPIFQLAETGNIEAHWRSVNQWTAKHFPEVAKGLGGHFEGADAHLWNSSGKSDSTPDNTSFVAIVECPNCTTKNRARNGPGRYRCGSCKKIIEVSG